eukprot:UN01764
MFMMVQGEEQILDKLTVIFETANKNIAPMMKTTLPQLEKMDKFDLAIWDVAYMNFGTLIKSLEIPFVNVDCCGLTETMDAQGFEKDLSTEPSSPVVVTVPPYSLLDTISNTIQYLVFTNVVHFIQYDGINDAFDR